MNRVFKANGIANKQRGFTLIELLVSMLIGLIILGAVISIFVSMVQADNDYLKSVRLNQELRAAMSLIARDIRRAGSNQNSAVNSATTPPTNPFSVSGGTRLTIAANKQGLADSCLTYSYDANDGSNELYGYRHNSTDGSVEVRSAGAACDANGWLTLTDEDLVNITALIFGNTTVSESGVNIRQITVTLSGRLRNDTTVTRTLTENVRVRNDEI